MAISLVDILAQWEYYGVFDILLPFLLIFAVVFGIMSSTKFLGENKGVYVVVAFTIGLISLRWRYFVSDFMSEIFPRLGVGLAVLMTILILVGIFIARDESRYWGWGLASIGFIIAIVVVYQSFDRLGLSTWGYGDDSVGMIILAVLLIGVIIAIAASGSHKSGDKSKGKAVFLSGWGDKD